MARMAELRRQREDPLIDIEGDTDVDEPYEIQEEVHEENVDQEEHGDHEELEKEVLPHAQKRKKLKVRKGPTTRSHASLEQQFEDVWVPSFDDDPDPCDLKEEQDDGAVPLPFVLGSKSRAKKPKPRVWYHEDRESPQLQFAKKLCFDNVYQFRRALLTFHIAHNRNYQFHRNCNDRIIVVCTYVQLQQRAPR